MSIQGTLISVLGSTSSIVGNVTPVIGSDNNQDKQNTPKVAPSAPQTAAPSAPPATAKKEAPIQSAQAAAPQPKSRKKITAAEASLKAMQYTRDAMDQKRSNSMRTAMMANDRFGGMF